MSRLTLHIDCTTDWEKAKRFLAQSGVTTAFLLNANPEQIQYALDNCSGIVTVRVYDPFGERRFLGDNFEKDIVFRKKPVDFVNWMNSSDYKRFRGVKRARFILGWNEMYYGGSENQRQQNSFMIDIATAMITAGYGVALFGLAADKTIQLSDVHTGIWNSVIEFFKLGSIHRDWAHLDVHEYEVGRMASQHLKDYFVEYPRSMADPLSMRFSNWGDIPKSGKAMEGNYHIGRYYWIQDYARNRYGYDIPVARGEYGADYKADGALDKYINGEYRRDFPRPSGYNTLRPLYNHLVGKELNDKEYCEEIYKDLLWGDNGELQNAVFAHNKQSDHAAFNLANGQYDYLYELMGKQLVKDNPPMPIPSDKLIPMQIRSTTGSWTNIRASATTASNKLGQIEGTLTDALVSQNWNETGLEWVKVKLGTITGYTSRSLVEIVPRPVNPPPTEQYTVTIDGFEIIGTLAEMQNYHKILSGLFQTILVQFENPQKL